MTQVDCYFLCTSPRSGSTLLCKLLEDCGAGVPDSYFHRTSLNDWRSGLSLSPTTSVAEIFKYVIRVSRGQSAIGGVRLQAQSRTFFCEQLHAFAPDHPDDLQRIKAIFGRTAFIHLSRSDKLEQAVSLIRAQQSGLWHRNADGTVLEHNRSAQKARFDPDLIRAELKTFERMDEEWDTWFSNNRISPMQVTYDQLDADPEGTIRGILRHLDLPEPVARTIHPRTARLADQINADWITRYRAIGS